MSAHTRDEPIALTRWIRGQLAVHFRSGHVARLEVSLASAHSVRLQVDGVRGGDDIEGLQSHNGWLNARSEEVVLTEWTPDPDYGWRDTPLMHRDQLAQLGMQHGVLHALAELWADRGGSPAYSIAAVSVLYGVAINARTTRGQWDQMARAVEGPNGAELVASIWEDLAERHVARSNIENTAESDQAGVTDDVDERLDEQPAEHDHSEGASTSESPSPNAGM